MKEKVIGFSARLIDSETSLLTCRTTRRTIEIEVAGEHITAQVIRFLESITAAEITQVERSKKDVIEWQHDGVSHVLENAS